jgi:hypothetical protein
VNRKGLPPPAPDCLSRPYSSNPKHKGGTLIVEDVTDRETHERRLCDPDGYRPRACPGCGHEKLHVHDYPERWLYAEEHARRRTAITLVRYLCAACRATWRMMPAFVARMLWRSWAVVEAVTLEPPRPAAPLVPERTVRRWRARLGTAALLLVGVLREHGGGALESLATAVGSAATRLQLVEAYAAALTVAVTERLAGLAAVLHRLAPGVRLM